MVRKFIGEIKRGVEKHWVAILIVMAILACIFNILLFYPGYMSNDTLTMYYTARGNTPTDIAPVVLGLVWRILYFITGKTSTMLIFQLAMLWSSLCLFAIYVYKNSKSRLLSIVCLLIGGLPFIINISGVIWRDNQMVFSLLLALAISLFAKDVKNKKWRISLFAIVFVLALYAALSRVNALAAVVPIFFLIVKMSGYIKKTSWQIVATILFIPLVLVGFPIVNKIVGVRHIANDSGVFLDDIVRVSKDTDLSKISMPEDLRNSLLEIRQCSIEKNILVSNIHICAFGHNREMLYEYDAAMRGIWVQVSSSNIVRYIQYKAELFASFLVPQIDYTYIWQPGIEPNDYNESVRFPELGAINYSYVHKFGYKYLRAAFEPWFWLILGMVVFGLSMRKKTKNATIIRLISISGIVYILGYIPTGIPSDYRYIYWSVFSVIFAFIIYRADIHRASNKQRR